MLLKYVVLFGGLLLAACLPAQAQADDHLVPPQSIFSNPTSADYKALVRRKLTGEGTHRFSVAQMIVLPSFQPEYSLSVEQTSWQVYVLTYRQAQTSIYSATQTKIADNARQLAKTGAVPSLSQPWSAADSVGVSTSRVTLMPTLGQALIDLFNVALAQTRYPTHRYMRGDGTSFTFLTFQPGVGYRTGETWSPAPLTDMSRLVEVVETLRLLALATPDRPGPSEAGLLQETQDALFQLASH
jgi:hypothetical protein